MMTSDEMIGSSARFFSAMVIDDGWLSTLKANESVAVRVIDCSAAVNKQKFFDVAAPALSFASYFGRNWDAFVDCFDELAWQPPNHYVVVLRHADHLLVGADNAHDLSTFVSILVEGFQPREELPDPRLWVVVETGHCAPIVTTLIAAGQSVVGLE